MRKSFGTILQVTADSVIKFIDKSASKKFFSWVVGTHMAYIGLLEPNSWMVITLVWLGIQGGIDYKKFTSPALSGAGSVTESTS